MQTNTSLVEIERIQGQLGSLVGQQRLTKTFGFKRNFFDKYSLIRVLIEKGIFGQGLIKNNPIIQSSKASFFV